MIASCLPHVLAFLAAPDNITGVMTGDPTDKPKSPLEALKPADATANSPVASSRADIAAFVNAARAAAPLHSGQSGERGRLIFAMDATMSRQPTWDRACDYQAAMFDETARLGGLDVKLVYFRGQGECKASKWVSDPSSLGRLMSSIACRGGRTQIGKVLTRAIQDAGEGRVGALVYVGDCMEEDADWLCDKAGELALRGTPVFLFQEGREPLAEATFREIARITKGAYFRFDAQSAQVLRDLLRAVAAYASGGRPALADLSRSGSHEATKLLEQLR